MSSAGRRPRVGARFVAVAALVAAVVASGTVLSRAGARSPGAGSGPTAATGAWFCPHGGGSGWKGWVSVANPGRAAVTVRLTTYGPTGAPVVSSQRLAPGVEEMVSVPAEQVGAATAVEYFGGWVAAASVVESAGTGADVAAERCVAGLERRWLLPDVTTAPGEDGQVVVMNPYPVPAEFNVVIRTNDRVIRPGEVTPAVLQPFSSTALHLGGWALESAAENAVTAQVVPLLGRVVAGSLVVSPRGVRGEAGIPAEAARWVIPAAGYAGSPRLSVMNLGARPSTLSVVAEGPDSEASVSAIAGTSLEAGAVGSFDAGSLANAGLDVVAQGSAAVAAAVRLEGANGGEASITGAVQAARRWIVLPTMPPGSGGAATLVLQNPDRVAAAVTVELLGPAGSVAAPGIGTVQVPAGRTISIPLPRARAPLAALVTATSGSVVAGGSSTSLGGSAYAATSGVPIGVVR